VLDKKFYAPEFTPNFFGFHDIRLYRIGQKPSLARLHQAAGHPKGRRLRIPRKSLSAKKTSPECCD